ncbi:uncharacterized protein LOC135475932 [Liolophura sinensis]|uniref:uncharacterized protein LOC135475932 n=1 Tax=Liolophura sinensis TaxID=3198878 RepID=UPI0031587744
MKVALCLLTIVIAAITSSEGAVPYAYAPMLYTFHDLLAQSACAARSNETQRVWALRRSCCGVKTCNRICNEKRLLCIHAYFVDKNPLMLPRTDDRSITEEGSNGLSMTNFMDGCSWRAGHCGPNYCCCEGKWDTIFAP